MNHEYKVQLLAIKTMFHILCDECYAGCYMSQIYLSIFFIVYIHTIHVHNTLPYIGTYLYS